MFAEEAELTPYGRLMLHENPECEFCERSMVARFGGVVDTHECPSCRDDFHKLNAAGKVTLETA